MGNLARTNMVLWRTVPLLSQNLRSENLGDHPPKVARIELHRRAWTRWQSDRAALFLPPKAISIFPPLCGSSSATAS